MDLNHQHNKEITSEGNNHLRHRNIVITFIILLSYEANYERQRALVLQGCGALWSYEARAISGLCKEIIKEHEKNGIIDRSVFDIIIGTLIGAINGSILVSQFLEKRKINLISHWLGAKQ